MKSRVKCRIEWAGIKYLLGRCVGEGGVEISFACGYIYIYIGVVCLFSGAKGLNGRRGLSLGSTGAIRVQVLIKTWGLSGEQNVGELKLCVEKGVVLFWIL